MGRFWSRLKGPWSSVARSSRRGSGAARRCALNLEVLESRTLLSFGAPINTRVGPGAGKVVVADFNLDGVPDMVVANQGSGTVSVLLGNGDGTFLPAGEYGVGRGISSPTGGGDVSGDGIPDIVVAADTSNGPAVLLLRGNGDGTFQDPQVIARCEVACSDVALIDPGTGGPLNLAVANAGDDPTRPGFVEVWTGHGDGTFEPAGRYPVQGTPAALRVADLDGDGLPDIVTANTNTNSVSILYGTSDGLYRRGPDYRVGVAPGCLSIGDVDGDGLPDIVTSDFGTGDADSSVSVLHNQGDGTFAQARQIVIRIRFRDVTIVITINLAPGTTQQTIAAAGYTDSLVHTFAQDASGGFSETGRFPAGAGPVSLATADFNGDGLDDLAVSNSLDDTVSVLLQGGAAPGPGGRAPGGSGLGAVLTPNRPTPGYVTPTAPAATPAAMEPGDVDRAFAPASEVGTRLTPARPVAAPRGEHPAWGDFFAGDVASLLYWEDASGRVL